MEYKISHIYNNFNTLINNTPLLNKSIVNPSDVDDFLEENTLNLEDTPELEKQSFSADVDNIAAADIETTNMLEQSKQSELSKSEDKSPKEENKIYTHEELLAQGYVLDADGDYVKKIPKWKFNRNANINAKINTSIMSK